MSNFIRKTFLLFTTVKYLKLEQIVYQLLNRFQRKRKSKISLSRNNITFIDYIFPAKEMSFDGKKFHFLNISKEVANWNDKEMSKLWLYHLHYFDYICSDLTVEISLKLIKDWIMKNPPYSINAWEPYSTSLRIINWIKFLSQNRLNEEKIVSSLISQVSYLDQNLEKHILANHYLTNLKAMLFAAVFFNNTNLIEKYLKLFFSEVKNQFLSEGVHYELTPAYHALLLNDIMEIYLILKERTTYHKEANKLKDFIQKGYQYYQLFLMPNSKLVRFGDTCIFNTPKEDTINSNYNNIFKSPSSPKIQPKSFKRINQRTITSIFKLKSFLPSYQPGHSHCDIGSYELFLNKKPIIVDTGISTYQESERRLTERSSLSHNVLIRNGENQANIWKAFRVANRPKKQIFTQTGNCFEIKYHYKNICFSRKVEESEKSIIVLDKVSKKGNLESIIHLHPDVSIDREGDKLTLKHNEDSLFLTTQSKIEISEYDYAEDFNILRKANYIKLINYNSKEISYKLYEK